MEKIDFSSYIERYIAGEMSNTERRWFEKELEGSEILRKEVELRKKAEIILKNMDHLSLRGKLSEIEKERAHPEKIVRKRVPAYLKYAAVITILIGVGTLTYQPWADMSNEEILSKFYRSYEPPTARRSGTTETNTLFSMALDMYNTQDYEKAAVLFSKVIESNPKDMQSMLLNGVANFETNNYPKAKQSLNQVIDDNNNLFIDQAEWYLALCFIKTGESEKAKIRLTAIKAGEGIYRSEAKKILRKLK